MVTARKAINDEAVDILAGVCRERINEVMDDLLKYVNASEQPGKLTLTISIGPVKDTPGAFHVDVIPKLAVGGTITEGAATIERVGNQLQLKLAGM